ncbi:CBN-GST-8 protein, partial [Aphelenchoides avenae]
MVHYKLTYFDCRALGEVSRFMFHYAGQPFEDVRIRDEEWNAQLQSKTPYGRMPVLEVDGVQIAESMTIARYLAKQLGLRKKDDLEEAKIESLADFQMDVWTSTIKYIGAKLGFLKDVGDA